MATYYISGPMRGKPHHNREMFNEVESALVTYLADGSADPENNPLVNNEVINPSRNFNGDQTLEPSRYMALDLQQVLQADVIVQLPDWQSSEGAKREAQLALWAGKRFMKAIYRYPASDWQFLNMDGPEFSTSLRAGLLDEAKQLITGDRNASYGKPTQDFERSAKALTAYGYRGPDNRELLPHDIALFIMAVKMSRLMWTPTKRDSWIDIAGYAGCGYECAFEENL